MPNARPRGLVSATRVRAVVEAFVAARGDVNARDRRGDTPLHESTEAYLPSRRKNPETGELDTVHLVVSAALLAAGADPALRNEEGETAWDLAQDNEHLRGTDAYWRLNDSRFNGPPSDSSSARRTGPDSGRAATASPPG